MTDARPIHHAVERLSKRTVKFIRWLKNHFDLERDWDHAIARLNEMTGRMRPKALRDAVWQLKNHPSP